MDWNEDDFDEEEYADLYADEDEAAFQDITKHRFFNTNNLWVDLHALKAAVSKHDNRSQWEPQFACMSTWGQCGGGGC